MNKSIIKITDHEEKESQKVIENIDDEFKLKACTSYSELPKAVYFITITELCERFTYYGLRAILILYLTQHLLLQEDNAISIYHLFICLCYFTTIIGSFISDNYFGKYKTLVFTGIIYTTGCILMSLTSILERNITGPLISLFLIAFGTGGVKACVSPFGGDQIPIQKKLLLNTYFSMFYLSINLGALLSTIITPILRAEIACNGSDDCYPLAFGVPAVLMATALLIFLVGRPYYVEVPVEESIYMKSARCIIVSIKVWYRERYTDPKKNLLDYASNEYNEEFISDLRTLYNIVILFLPLTIYWAMFEQMGSRWTLQATQMDGEITSNIFILPDQMFIFNVILIIVLIVIFENCIYPLYYRFDPIVKPLRKMTIGIIFTFLAFIGAFVLQKYMEDIQPSKIDLIHSRLILVNTFPCDILLTVSDGRFLKANRYQTSALFLDTLSGNQQIQLKFIECDSKTYIQSIQEAIKCFPGQINFIIPENNPMGNITVRVVHDIQAPNIKGFPIIRLITVSGFFDKYRFKLRSLTFEKVGKNFLVLGNPYFSPWEKLSKPGRYSWKVISPSVPYNKTTVWSNVIIYQNGIPEINLIKIVSSEVSTFYMTYDNLNDVIVIPLTIHKGSQVSILWQLPQYLLMAIGEVLINIPGLTFSYDQAPLGMKSLVNALWYFCGGLGNIIVIIVAKVHFFEKQSFELLIFALICSVFSVVFARLAYMYQMKQKEEYSEIN